MKKIITYSLLAASIFFSSGCTGETLNSAKQLPPEVKMEDSISSNQVAFSGFWEEFKEAVLAKDISGVIRLTHFPFIDGYSKIYNPSETLSCQNKKEFNEKFHLIFDDKVIDAI